jgi:hypothetical protein
MRPQCRPEHTYASGTDHGIRFFQLHRTGVNFAALTEAPPPIHGTRSDLTEGSTECGAMGGDGMVGRIPPSYLLTEDTGSYRNVPPPHHMRGT